MTEQKKPGRPKEYGAKAFWAEVKNAPEVKAAIESVAKNWAGLEEKEIDRLLMPFELLTFLLDHCDLVLKFSDGDFSKAAEGHPALAELLDTRLRPDVYLNKHHKAAIDAALRAYMNEVLQENQRIKNNEDTKSQVEKRIMATKAIAAKLISENQGKRPRHFWKTLANELEPDFGGVSKSTSDRDLKA